MSGTGGAPLTSSSRKMRSLRHARSTTAQRGLRLRGRQLLDPRQLPLEFVGERDDRVEADHLDRAGGLVDVRARVLERRRIAGIGRERGERLQPARQRLVDFTLHPGQRAQVEFGSRIGRHGVQLFA